MGDERGGDGRAERTVNGWLFEAGFNLIHTGANREELDQARAHKMYTWVTLGLIDPAKLAESDARFCERLWSSSRVRRRCIGRRRPAGRAIS